MNRDIRGKLIVLLSPLICLLSSTPLWAADSSEEPWRQGAIFAARPATREVTFTGYTRARHVLGIVSEEDGRCTNVEADVGNTIGEDGIFCVLDTTFIDLAIKKNSVDQERLMKNIIYYGKEVRRCEQLLARESVAQSKLDALQNTLDQAEFELQALTTEEANLNERRKRHVVGVPSGWILTERNVESGEWISAGTRVGKAGDFRKLLVPFSFSPDEYNALRKLKETVKLRFPDEGEKGIAVEVKVERISPAFDPETRKISVDLSVREGLPHMRGGLRAELDLQLPDPTGAVLVPTSALSERYEDFWLTRENGEQVRVVLLDHRPDSTSRVRSADVRPGDRFRVQPKP